MDPAHSFTDSSSESPSASPLVEEQEGKACMTGSCGYYPDREPLLHVDLLQVYGRKMVPACGIEPGDATGGRDTDADRAVRGAQLLSATSESTRLVHEAAVD